MTSAHHAGASFPRERRVQHLLQEPDEHQPCLGLADCAFKELMGLVSLL
jgi:hypothetical protein